METQRATYPTLGLGALSASEREISDRSRTYGQFVTLTCTPEL